MSTRSGWTRPGGRSAGTPGSRPSWPTRGTTGRLTRPCRARRRAGPSDRPLEGRVLLDLLNRRQADQHLVEPVVPQRTVSHLGRGPGDLLHALALGDHLADLLGDEDELVERHPPPEPGAAAVGAAPPAEERDIRQALLLEV